MHALLNIAIGFLTTGLVVLAVIYVFNKVSKGGGVAKLGTQPLLSSVKGG